MSNEVHLHMKADSFNDFLDYLQELDDTPHPKHFIKQLEGISDEKLLGWMVNDKICADEVFLHIPVKRMQVLVNTLYEQRPDLFS